MSRRTRIIDDPHHPFKMRIGVRYHVVTDSDGRLVVREAKFAEQPVRSWDSVLKDIVENEAA